MNFFYGRPYLILEVDEHTSDIGIITRCEAFLNNIWEAKKVNFSESSQIFKPFIFTPKLKRFDGIMYIPYLFESFRVLEPAFESIGIRTKFLPPHDETTANLGKKYCSGKECLPYIMFMGDVLRMTQDREFNPDKDAIFIPGTNLSCRASIFATGAQLLLKKLHPRVSVIAPRTSLDIDEIVRGFGPKVGRIVYRGVMAIELLNKKLLQVRPYERNKGESDKVYEAEARRVCKSLVKGGFLSALDAAIRKFDQIEKDTSQKRPVIGIIGDDYTRSNSFINNNLIKEIESLGGEVWNLPLFSPYLEFQRVMKPRKMLARGRLFDYVYDVGKSAIEQFDKYWINRVFTGRLKGHPDPDFYKMMKDSSHYLDERFEPSLMIDLAYAVFFIQKGVDGIAVLVGFQCIIHSIATAAIQPLRKDYNNIPVLTLYFDLLKRSHQRNRIEAFMYQVKQFRERKNRLDPPTI